MRTVTHRTTRRALLRAAGATVALAAGSTPVAARGEPADEAQELEWIAVDTPIGTDLNAAVGTDARAYAVGDGGVVLERVDGDWSTAADDGPDGSGTDLHGVDATDDRKQLWIVGDDGTVGVYDVEEETLSSHPGPEGVSETFTDVAVIGNAGAVNVYVASSAGRIHSSLENGTPGTWHAETPGSGGRVTALDVYAPENGHAVDESGAVFSTSDGGESWHREGIDRNEKARHGLYSVDSHGAHAVIASGGGGSVYRLRSDGLQWIDTTVGHAVLRGIESEDGVRETPAIAVGNDGQVFRRPSDQWRRESTPTDADLHGVLMGTPDLAVGTGGTIIEYRSASDSS